MFRSRDCSEGHIILGLILSLISWICLTLVTFSTPYIKSIYYLHIPSSQTRYGNFGYCTASNDGCIGPQIGYSASAPDGNGEIVEWLTKTLILFGLDNWLSTFPLFLQVILWTGELIQMIFINISTAALFMLLAWITLILSLMKVGKFMWNPVYFRTTGLLGSLMAILSSSFAISLFVIARRKYNDQGLKATYGPALWLALVGTISGFLSAAIGGPAYQGNYMYHADRRQAYNV